MRCRPAAGMDDAADRRALGDAGPFGEATIHSKVPLSNLRRMVSSTL
jgi:hypothetical protein